jgi:hypothetical protein
MMNKEIETPTTKSKSVVERIDTIDIQIARLNQDAKRAKIGYQSEEEKQ